MANTVIAQAPAIRLENLVKNYGRTMVVRSISLDVMPGEIVALLGPSGCGKTTTLRMIAGLVEPTDGKIVLFDKEISHVPVNRRNVGILFQSYALFPHMTVEKNIAFGLSVWQRRTPPARMRELVAEAIRLVRLQGFEKRYPSELSGGQQQRVALARALVVEPQVLLLDEPFGALDKALRVEMQDEVRALTTRLGLTTVLVTHDQEEAMIMADRIAVMNGGLIAQIGTAADLYERPADPFIADFIGTTNVFDVVVGSDGMAVDASSGLSFPLAGDVPTGSVKVALRPERVRLDDGGSLMMDVTKVSYRGTAIAVSLKHGSGRVVEAAVINDGRQVPSVGDSVRVGWRPQDIMVLA
jgi:putative spermidine/putrescine transport system ATP-binding protein